MIGLRDPLAAILSLLLGLYLGTQLPNFRFDSSGVALAHASPANNALPGTWQLTATDKAALIKAASFISRKGRTIAHSHEAAILYRSVDKRLAETENAAARSNQGVAPSLRSMRLHVRLALADAINAEARARTHSNTLIRRGTLDLDPAFRKIWSELMPEALMHAAAAKAGFEKLDVKVVGLPGVIPPPAVSEDEVTARRAVLPPGLPLARGTASQTYELWLLPVYLDSFLLEGSSKGIVQQALTGVGTTFLALAQKIIKEYPNFDPGVGHAYLGAFYTVAPWPLGNLKTAQKHMATLNSISPKSRRNRYYSGIVAFRQQRWADAAADFEAALKLTCLSPVEQDFCDFITEEAKQGAIEARALAAYGSKSRAYVSATKLNCLSAS